MIALTILSIVTVCIVYGFIIKWLYDFGEDNYSFNIFGRGCLSLIPPALGGLGAVITSFRDINYLEALTQKDLDVLVTLVIASISFLWVFIVISKETNFGFSLLLMLIAPPALFLVYIVTITIAAGFLSSPVGWLILIFLSLSNNNR